ncbi:unnamed protein product, partial [Polarella glacialis]
WSMVCLADGAVVSTVADAVQQRPVEELGGGDAWLAGVIDGLALAADIEKASPRSVRPVWSEAEWAAALRRGDRLAALSQEEIGDFSTVARGKLEQALR